VHTESDNSQLTSKPIYWAEEREVKWNSDIYNLLKKLTEE
jgi:hypothetical protein